VVVPHEGKDPSPRGNLGSKTPLRLGQTKKKLLISARLPRKVPVQPDRKGTSNRF